MKLLVVSFIVCAALRSTNGYLPSETENGYYGAKNAFEVPLSLQEPQRCYKYDVKSAPTEQPEDIKFTFNFDLHKPVTNGPKTNVNTYDATVQAMPTASDVLPKRVFGYVIQKPDEPTPDYVPIVTPHCGCQECSAALEGPPMPSMMLPVQYHRTRRSADTNDARERIRQKYSEKLSGHIETLKSLKVKTVGKFEQTKQYAQEQVAKIKQHISPILSKPSEFVQGFIKNFEKPVAPRQRRSVTETPAPEPLMPTLKVVENPKPCCPVIQDLKDNSEFRSRVAQPDVLQYMPEVGVNADDADKQKHCPQCGAQLTDSTCTTCAQAPAPAQPQYFRYVDGAPVPFVPRAAHSSPKRSAVADYHVYDRLGHTYEANNGNLRLLAPSFEADPETAQPNYEAFAHIMNDNAEIMHELNPFEGDRMVAPVTHLAADGLDFIHDITRRDANSHPDELKPEESQRSNYVKNHYQIIPIRHENRNGSLISKLYSNNGKVERSENEPHSKSGNQKDNKDDSDKSVSLQKVNHNNNEYEILTINAHQSADSAEEFDRIMKFLHAGRMKRNANNKN